MFLGVFVSKCICNCMCVFICLRIFVTVYTHLHLWLYMYVSSVSMLPLLCICIYISVSSCIYVISVLVSVSICWLVGCLTSQQHACVSQGQTCSNNFTCCHTEVDVADQTFYLTQPQYTDTRPTSPSADPIMPDAWQGSHRSASFQVTSMT